MDTCFANGRVRPTILLLSGTCEGPPLARALDAAGFHVHATVTRQEASAHLFGSVAGNVQVEARGFTDETLEAFLRRKEADLVLDATHPFAARITCIAHGVCTRLGVPYVRYDRPDWPAPAGTRLVDTFSGAAEMLVEMGRRRVMLTIGAKQLKHFAHLHDRFDLFARILPSPVSLEQAYAAGFSARKVLCLRPPFSTAFNKALFSEYRAEVLVTKASGSEGGVAEKVLAARELEMQVVMIRRPVIPDMVAVHTLDGAVDACRRVFFV